MKGTNLGNWLVPEGYMFLFKDASSPKLISETITELIGPDAPLLSEKNILIIISQKRYSLPEKYWYEFYTHTF